MVVDNEGDACFSGQVADGVAFLQFSLGVKSFSGIGLSGYPRRSWRGPSPRCVPGKLRRWDRKVGGQGVVLAIAVSGWTSCSRV